MLLAQKILSRNCQEVDEKNARIYDAARYNCLDHLRKQYDFEVYDIYLEEYIKANRYNFNEMVYSYAEDEEEEVKKDPKNYVQGEENQMTEEYFNSTLQMLIESNLEYYQEDLEKNIKYKIENEDVNDDLFKRNSYFYYDGYMIWDNGEVVENFSKREEEISIDEFIDFISNDVKKYTLSLKVEDFLK